MEYFLEVFLAGYDYPVLVYTGKHKKIFLYTFLFVWLFILVFLLIYTTFIQTSLFYKNALIHNSNLKGNFRILHWFQLYFFIGNIHLNILAVVWHCVSFETIPIVLSSLHLFSLFHHMQLKFWSWILFWNYSHQLLQYSKTSITMDRGCNIE